MNTHNPIRMQEECGATHQAGGFSESPVSSLVLRFTKDGLEIARYIPTQINTNMATL